MFKTLLPKLQGSWESNGRGSWCCPERLCGSAWKWGILNIGWGKYFCSQGNLTRLFQRVHDVKIIFIIIWIHYLPFPLSFSPEFPVKFSRSRVMCDLTTDWMQKCAGECSCLLLSQILKRFPRCKTMLFFLLSNSDLRKTKLFSWKNVFMLTYIFNIYKYLTNNDCSFNT